jgi:probable F420-dependent oxidoreductase
MRPLKVGLALPDAEGMLDGATARWSDLAAYARLADEAGFDSLWVEDHLLFRFEGGRQAEGLWECFSLLAALAAATSRVEIGSLVACSAFRNPALTAKMADTIDEISGGRLVLGMGAGWNWDEFRAMGLPFDHRVGRVEEAIHIIHSLLRTGSVDFAGRFYNARECELRPRGPRAGGPPIMIGSTGERMLGIAARFADQWNDHFIAFGNHPAGVRAPREKVDAACRAAGRDPATLERTLVVLVDVVGGSMIPDSVGAGVPPLSGTPEEIADGLRAFAAEGISHVQVYAMPMTLAGIEAFAPVLEQLDRG